jgi:hypothetical protein
MLRILIYNGTMWAKEILIDGTLRDDLISIVEEYALEHKEEFAKYTFEEIEDQEDEFTPINGGEFYIGMILSVKEVIL